MRAKQVDFEVTYVNLRDKPDWFLEISPHGKVPVLKVGDEVLFESNAIAEYLDETVSPRLHPEDPIKRARNRAWTDFIPDFAKPLTKTFYGKTREEIDEALEDAKVKLKRVEDAIARERGNDGPYFNGPEISLVDAAYAPFFQRFTMADSYLKTGLLDDFPLVKAWRDTLLADPTVTGAVADVFEEEFVANAFRRESYLSTLIGENPAAAAE